MPHGVGAGAQALRRLRAQTRGSGLRLLIAISYSELFGGELIKATVVGSPAGSKSASGSVGGRRGCASTQYLEAGPTERVGGGEGAPGCEGHICQRWAGRMRPQARTWAGRAKDAAVALVPPRRAPFRRVLSASSLTQDHISEVPSDTSDSLRLLNSHMNYCWKGLEAQHLALLHL